jgi:LysM repeat protein
MVCNGISIIGKGATGNGARRLLYPLMLCLLLLLVAAAPRLYGAFEDDTAGARMKGLAGVGCAADDSEAVFGQPAGLAVLKNTDAGFSYGKLFTGLSDQSDLSGGIFTLGIPLSKNSGAGFAYKNIALRDAYSEQTAAAAFGFRPYRFMAVGATVKYLGISYGTDDYTRIDPVFVSRQGKNALDADAGLLLFFSPSVSFSYSRRNLIGADIGIDEQAPLAAQDRFGLAYREESFLMAAEYVQEGQDNRILSGMEKTLARGLFSLRLGAGWGTSDFRKITTGLRVNAGQFSLDYAFDFPLGGIDGTSGTHYVTLVLKVAPAPDKKKTVRAPVKKLPLALPGMLPETGNKMPAAPVAVAVTTTSILLVPELQPVTTGALRAPLSSLLDFTARISSATERVRCAIETSTTNIIVDIPVPKPEPKAHPLQAERSKNEKKPLPVAETNAAVRPVQAEPAVFRAASGARTHKVMAGDTLPALAEKYYGRRTDWYKIYEANKDRIEKGALEPGQVLIIP